MSDAAPHSLPPEPTPAEWAALARADQRRRWQVGDRVLVETYLDRHPTLRDDPDAVLDLIDHEAQIREEQGEAVTEIEYLVRFPAHAVSIHRRFALQRASAAGRIETMPAPRPAPLAALGTEAPTLAPSNAASAPTQDFVADNGEILEVIPIAVAAAKRVLPRIPGYEVLSELGRGGMGVVYKARQVGFNRIVALKMLLAGAHADPEQMERFRREAEAVARLKHRGIVDVYAFGELDNCPYFSLEYLEGGSLADRLGDRPLPAREAAVLVEAVAHAVHHAHQHGIVHRDLKPANVLLTADGRPKITDFGLAKRLEMEGKTQSGAVMGTPGYMAPEQAEGKTRQIGPAADIYSLGAVLYECLTGRPPFRAATTLDTLLLVLTTEPTPPSNLNAAVPPELETICLKCLQKKPAQRYDSARLVAEDLACFGDGKPLRHATPPTGWRTWNARSWRETNVPLWALIVLAALAVIAVPFCGRSFALLPTAAAVLTAGIQVRRRTSAILLVTAAFSLSAAAAVGYFVFRSVTYDWFRPPWGELLILAPFVVGVVPFLAALLLGGRQTRWLAGTLVAAGGLGALGWFCTGGPFVLILGTILGGGFASIGRIVAWRGGTPVGVPLVGGLIATMLNPCSCGWCVPMILVAGPMLESGRGLDFEGPGGGESISMASAALPLFLVFTVIGAIINVLIYRSRQGRFARGALALSRRQRSTPAAGGDRTLSQ
jgi:predicted Ser/Thr protein kinase